MVVYKVVGIGKGTSKKNNNREFVSLHVTCADQYVEGLKAANYFFWADFSADIKNIKVGSEIHIFFDENGRAVGVQLVK